MTTQHLLVRRSLPHRVVSLFQGMHAHNYVMIHPKQNSDGEPTQGHQKQTVNTHTHGRTQDSIKIRKQTSGKQKETNRKRRRGSLKPYENRIKVWTVGH